MTDDKRTQGAAEGKGLARRDFITGAALALVTVTTVAASGATATEDEAQAFASAMHADALRAYRAAPEAAGVARRCGEIWNAQRERDEAAGTDYKYGFMRCVDEVLEASSDGLMVGSPNDALFTFLFIRAAAEYGDEPAPNQYTELLDTIGLIDDGHILKDLFG
ncbi:MAG: hypothetical protein ABW250_12045, partial [Pyrinomonadaceae bacterium]